MRKKQLQELEHRISVAEDYVQVWARLFNYFADGFENRRVTAEEEAGFFKAMTEAARKEFRLSYLMSDEFSKGKDALAFLSAAVSLASIASLSEGQFAKFQHDWHVIFIALNKCLGRLIEQRPVSKNSEGGSDLEQNQAEAERAAAGAAAAVLGRPVKQETPAGTASPQG